MELTVPFDRGDGGGMFVSQLVQSITNASSSLAMSSDNNTTTDSNHLSLQGNSGSLVSEIDAFLTSVRDARIHDHINALYLISTSTSSSSPLQSPSISSYNSFSLNSLIHSTTLDAIDRIHSLLSQEREHRVTIMQTLHDEIHMFWEQLDVPVDERRMILTSKSSSSNGGKCIVAEEEDTFVFSDLGCVDECREYADSLRVKWAAVMRGKVDEVKN